MEKEKKSYRQHLQDVGSDILAAEWNTRFGGDPVSCKLQLIKMYGKELYLQKCFIVALAAHNSLLSGGNPAVPDPDDLPEDGCEF